MKKIIINSVAFMCFLLSLSCKDDNENDVARPPYDPNKDVVCTRFFPDSGRIREKVILEGDNFGSDPSMIKVYFNYKPAKVVGSIGNQMYVVVPRLPGDTCVISVVVGKDSIQYDNKFRYKLSSQSSTIAGTGASHYEITNIVESSFKPYGVVVDDQSNVFLLTDGPTSPAAGAMLMINEEEQLITEIFRNKYTGCAPTPTKRKHEAMIFVSDVGVNVYYVVDKRRGYNVETHNVIWKRNPNMPFDYQGGPFLEGDRSRCKNAIAYCEMDSCYYTIYKDGTLARIRAVDDTAQVIAVLQQGLYFGMAFHPHEPYMLYFSHSGQQGGSGNKYTNTVCCLDVRDPENTFDNVIGESGKGGNGGGFQDGFLKSAKMNRPFQMYFDSQGLLYVADAGNHCVRRIDLERKTIETVIGVGGQAGFREGTLDEALFRCGDGENGMGLCVGPEDIIYVGDTGNHRLRKLAVE